MWSKMHIVLPLPSMLFLVFRILDKDMSDATSFGKSKTWVRIIGSPMSVSARIVPTPVTCNPSFAPVITFRGVSRQPLPCFKAGRVGALPAEFSLVGGLDWLNQASVVDQLVDIAVLIFRACGVEVGLGYRNQVLPVLLFWVIGPSPSPVCLLCSLPVRSFINVSVRDRAI